MPWTAKDAQGFTKAADTDAKQEQWAAVANDVLARCLEDGGDQAECEAKAIQQASGVIAKEARGEGLGVGGEPQGDGGVEMCVCPECGATAPHERGTPCVDQTCPECGAKMQPQAEEAESMPDEELTEVTKTVGGKSYPAGDFLVVEDPESPSTWHLQVKRNGEPDHGLMGAAWAALHGGYRGNKYEGPNRAEALRKLRALYNSEDMETPSEEAEPMDLPQLREILARALAYIDRQLAEQDAEPEAANPAETALAESASGHVIALAEQLPLPGSEKIVPLHLDVALIRPGWGNKRDNHYYPRDVVERDAPVFAGVKMYETDHRQDEKSTRTWVSTVKEIVGYTDDGAPIGRVSVHDRNFAERLMALAADDLLEKMECSILAAGTARKGEVDGRKGHVVEAITSAESVDWVTRAGCGGRALKLAETSPESFEELMADGYRRYWSE